MLRLTENHPFFLKHHMQNRDTIEDFQNKTKSWNKDFLGTDDDTLKITTIRDTFTLRVRQRMQYHEWSSKYGEQGKQIIFEGFTN